jgi:hypothetical protein
LGREADDGNGAAGVAVVADGSDDDVATADELASSIGAEVLVDWDAAGGPVVRDAASAATLLPMLLMSLSASSGVTSLSSAASRRASVRSLLS